MARRVKVFNVITKLSVGGAQETALRYCSELPADEWDTALVAGPESSPEGDLFDEAGRLGVRVITIPTMRRRIRPMADLRAVVALVGLFRQERPDIVHTHSSKAGLLGRLAARLAGVRVVVHTVHGWSFHDGMPPLGRFVAVAVERLASRWTNAIVVVADRDAELGLAAGIGRAAGYTLVRSGIDLQAYRTAAGTRTQARATLGIPEGVPVIGTVTRLCRQKDPVTLLRAARQVIDGRRDAHLVVVGDGPMRNECERLIDSLDLRANVTMLGPRADVAALLSSFDVFALSSRWEGLPRVVIEAMAVGVPVVAADVGGIAEAVEHEASGLLVPAGEPSALAGGLQRVLEDPALAARLQRGADARVNEFDTAQMINRLERLYVELLGGSRSRPRRRRMARTVSTESGHVAA